jgi:hypothetical protein
MLSDELSDLAIFAVVADARSFTRAAAKLGKSQSALSQSVRRLEERLKLRLLTRTTRSVMPTPAGEQLLSTLRPALGEIEAQLNALSELRELPSGSLRLTAGRHAVETVLWPVLLRLNTRYPDIKVEVLIEPALTDIVTEQYDAGVRRGEQIARGYLGRHGFRVEVSPVDSFGLVDVESMSAMLFASENVEDAALAVLFRNGHKPYMIRKIVQRIAQASKSESETLNAGALLTSFSGLRRAGEIVAMEWRKMNLPVNFEDSPLMKESYDRVRAETDANRLIAVITETLQRKFPNGVPPDLNGRLTALSVDELDAMFKRSIDAKSADDILTVCVYRKPYLS